MIEREILRPRKIIHNIKEGSRGDRFLLTLEALSLIAMGMYLGSAIDHAVRGHLDETVEPAINTMRMLIITGILYGFYKLPKIPSVREKFHDLMSIEEKPKPPKI